MPENEKHIISESSKERLGYDLQVIVAQLTVNLGLVVLWSIFIFLWEEPMEFILSVTASLVAAGIAAFIGYHQRGITFRKAIMSAPEKYIEHLDNLINDALKDTENTLTVNAKAIVSTRDDLKSSLAALSKLFNSDIDRLKEQLERNDEAMLKETIIVLSKKWPSKKDQIRIELSKLISEIGLKEMV
ncbi:MAG: hypothetical protein MI685_11610 [Chlorobiales bacterium]|nr:hypothetical protein [Chlorobiales bacterium]